MVSYWSIAAGCDAELLADCKSAPHYMRWTLAALLLVTSAGGAAKSHRAMA
jgi:hypothetical protein